MDTICSRKNPFVIHLKKLGADRGYRNESNSFICEGKKLLDDALDSGVNITAVLFSGDKPELPEHIRTVQVTCDIIETITAMKSAPDILFVCSKPESILSIGKGRHIILENLQDPGNVGTIVRTANAFGMDTVILAGACADPFSPKAVRASMGAVFRQKLMEIDCTGMITLFKAQSIPIYAADTENGSVDIRLCKLPDTLGIAIGNEGQGLSRLLLDASAGALRIPMNPLSESLNAAAAATVFMWELFK